MKIPVKANATKPRRMNLFMASSAGQKSRDARFLSQLSCDYVVVL
jgi:hypothetical protein